MDQSIRTGFWPLPYPPIRRLLDYWVDRRTDRRCPEKCDIDPIDVPDLLPDLILYDAPEDGGTFRYRLAGARATRLLGREVRGLTQRDIHAASRDPAVLKEVARGEREYAWIARTFTGSFRLTRLAVPDREHVQIARLTLPLSDAGGRANHLVTIMIETSGPLPAGLSHFGIDLVAMAPIALPGGLLAAGAMADAPVP
ncbi:MAG: PAS domain-containing protein [Alphaproteobacteria bacterium]|nr:PAS domain-containing protein [Alphaproteobacteria bacterium]